MVSDEKRVAWLLSSCQYPVMVSDEKRVAWLLSRCQYPVMVSDGKRVAWLFSMHNSDGGDEPGDVKL